MRRAINIFTITFLTVCCLKLFAQQIAGKAAAKTNEKPRKLFIPPVYLGHSAYSGGAIRKQLFDSLLKQGLSAHDSLGNIYRVAGFDFSYAERNLYEDSVANLVVLTDFQSEYCPGDTISLDLSLATETSPSIYQRTKAGDTVYFDHIRLFAQHGNKIFPSLDTLPILGRGMKFTITK